MKKISVEIKNKNTLILCQDANKGDYIDLMDITSIDTTNIENAILQAKDEVYKEKLNMAIKALQTQNELKNQQNIAEFNLKIQHLQDEIKAKQAEFENLKQLAINEAIKQKDEELTKLNTQILHNEKTWELKLNSELNAQNLQIQQLKNQILNEKNNFKAQLEMKNQEVEYYKDLKAKLSTKMLGESLETHCEQAYDANLRPFFANATFKKDNDISSGSKGDFIFRDFINDKEYISIMFEMKNESDESKNKHKNEEFFEKLHRDRKNKECEYAVLVSMLESDSELYNRGIVDVSHKFEKMFVIRPQFFEIILQLLCAQAKRIYESRTELEEVKKKEFDIANFERGFIEFKEKFGKNYRLANEKFQKAIAQIDKTIDQLNKIKEELLSSDKNYRLANEKLEDLSLKKLAKGSPNLLEKLNF